MKFLSPKETFYFILLSIGYALLTYAVSDHIFFWDTVQLGSKQAHHFYENGLSTWLLPDKIDSGHIPFFGWLLALTWKGLGKSLLSSHWMMFPFLIGIAFQVTILLKKHYLKISFLAVLVLLLDPTLLAQSTLVSPDILLIFFFLLGINSIKAERHYLIALSYSGLVCTSMRGMMVCAALLLWQSLIRVKKPTLFINSIFSNWAQWLPALGIFIIFNTYHWQNKGWIAFHGNSPWSDSFQSVGINGFMYNLGLVIWRILDFSRIFVFVLVFTLVVWRRNSLTEVVKKTKPWLILLACLTICIIPNLVLFQQLTAHRYLLPIILVLLVICILIIEECIDGIKLKHGFYVCIICLMLSGNFWIYPDKIAQGWDSSLAHLPYYNLRSQVIHYLEKENIALSSVSSVFPDVSESKFYNPKDNKTNPFKSFPCKDCQFILWSNIHNDYSDKQLDHFNSLEVLKRFESYGVQYILYKAR